MFSYFSLIYGTGGVEGTNGYCYMMTSRRRLSLANPLGAGVFNVVRVATCLLFTYSMVGCNICTRSISRRGPRSYSNH